MLLYFHAKVIIIDGCFSRLLSCTNGIKSQNATHKINRKWYSYSRQSAQIKEFDV